MGAPILVKWIVEPLGQKFGPRLRLYDWVFFEWWYDELATPNGSSYYTSLELVQYAISGYPNRIEINLILVILVWISEHHYFYLSKVNGYGFTFLMDGNLLSRLPYLNVTDYVMNVTRYWHRQLRTLFDKDDNLLNCDAYTIAGNKSCVLVFPNINSMYVTTTIRGKDYLFEFHGGTQNEFAYTLPIFMQMLATFKPSWIRWCNK